MSTTISSRLRSTPTRCQILHANADVASWHTWSFRDRSSTSITISFSPRSHQCFTSIMISSWAPNIPQQFEPRSDLLRNTQCQHECGGLGILGRSEQHFYHHTSITTSSWPRNIPIAFELLHEHHDVFLASQHPPANPTPTRLAAKYSMPAPMWRHGIHAFLEVLRYRFPDSLEHMFAFIYIAYSMMALLYETVPAFEDTWIECFGVLSHEYACLRSCISPTL